MTMVDIHEHVNLHILNIQAPMKPLMKKIQPKLMCIMRGTFDEAHDEAKGGQNGEEQPWTKPQEPNAGGTER